MGAWLPKEDRNRVALFFAAFAQVLFCIWNLYPITDWRLGYGFKFFGPDFWPKILHYRWYIRVFRSPDVPGMLSVAFSISLLMTSVMGFLIMPFWRFLHATKIIRMPLAISIMAGGFMVLLFMLSGFGSDSENPVMALMTLNMFSVATGLLVLGKDREWMPRAVDPRVPRGKPKDESPPTL